MIDNNTNNNKKEIGQQIVNDTDVVKSGCHANDHVDTKTFLYKCYVVKITIPFLWHVKGTD